MKNTWLITIIGFVVILGGFILLVLTKSSYVTFVAGIVLIFVGLVLALFSMEKGKKGKKKG